MVWAMMAKCPVSVLVLRGRNGAKEELSYRQARNYSSKRLKNSEIVNFYEYSLKIYEGK